MASNSYGIDVPRKVEGPSVSTDTEALQDQMQLLLARIDAAGETVIAIQAIQAGWGRPL
jgi:hypothetical protein